MRRDLYKDHKWIHIGIYIRIYVCIYIGMCVDCLSRGFYVDRMFIMWILCGPYVHHVDRIALCVYIGIYII